MSQQPNQCPATGKGHKFYAIERDFFMSIECACGAVLNSNLFRHLRLIKHMDPDKLSRLFVTLLQKGQLTPAESTLADHLMKEV